MAKQPAISLFTATCIVVANMIGTGIFTSLGFQVGELSSGFTIVVLWCVGGVCAMCGALAYGELAAALPRSGGEYHYLSVIYHPVVGFLAGWISITVGFAAPVALAAMAFGRYFSSIASEVDPLAMSLGVVGVVTAVHLCGTAVGSAFQNSATVLKVTLLLVLVAAGFVVGSSQPVQFGPSMEGVSLVASAPFAISLVYVLYAYSGWNASAYIVGEVRDPGRTVPLSIAIGTGIVALLYVLVNVVFLRTTPISEMEGKPEVAHVAATHIFGPQGGQVMAGLICAGLISSISAMTWIGPRVAMAMGEDMSALRWLARKTSGGIPIMAVLFQSAVVAVLLCAGTFEAVLTYVQLGLQLCSFFAVLGVIVLRRRRPELPRPYKTWGYPFTPTIYLLVSLWVMWHILRMNPRESLAGLATLMTGLVLYISSAKRGPQPTGLSTGGH